MKGRREVVQTGDGIVPELRRRKTRKGIRYDAAILVDNPRQPGRKMVTYRVLEATTVEGAIAEMKEVKARRLRIDAAEARKKRKPGYDHLYLIASDDGHLKIGRSHDPAKRLRGLQGASPVALTLVHMARGMGHLEERFITEFSDLHVRGEWFKDAPAIRVAMAELERVANLYAPIPSEAPRAAREAGRA